MVTASTFAPKRLSDASAFRLISRGARCAVQPRNRSCSPPPSDGQARRPRCSQSIALQEAAVASEAKSLVTRRPLLSAAMTRSWFSLAIGATRQHTELPRRFPMLKLKSLWLLLHDTRLLRETTGPYSRAPHNPPLQPPADVRCGVEVTRGYARRAWA